VATALRPNGCLFVLSGPSGSGKTELMGVLRAREPELHFCVTATTRKPRPGERDGVDYFFYDEDDFLRLLGKGGLLEYARVPPDTGYYYGTPRDQVEPVISAGRDVFTQADVQGARNLRAQVPSAVLIFLKPPDAETLQRRLVGRAAEAAPEMRRRLENAQTELGREPEFDYSVVNPDGGLEEAVEQVRAIMREARAHASDALPKRASG
jgi:guanylate kinase